MRFFSPHRSETHEIAERAVRRMNEDNSSVLVQSGLQESWSAEATECDCYLGKVQDLQADGLTPHERRFNSPIEGSIIPFGAEVKFCLISSKDQGRVHQFGTNVLPGLSIRYVLKAVGSWTGDLLTVDAEDLETMLPSESHMKRNKSKELDIQTRDNEFVFPGRTGEVLQEGQPLSTDV